MAEHISASKAAPADGADPPKAAPSKAELARLSRLVRDRRERDRCGLTVVEGPRAVDGALASGAVFEAIYVRPELAERYWAPSSGHVWRTPADSPHPDARRLGPDYACRLGTVCAVEAKTLDRIADAKNPQGVLGVAYFADAHLDEAAAAQRVVVLDAVRDPGNAGAVVRSAVASGFGSVIGTAGTTDLWSPKSLRGAAGLTFGPRVCRGHATAEVLEALGAAGHIRVRATPDAEASIVDVAEGLSSADHVTLVIGNEAHGPSPEAAEGTDIAVSIPMLHPVDSLNVAVAAAMFMFAMPSTLAP